MSNEMDTMLSLRDLWSKLNKDDFLNLFFEGWDRSDPAEYYHGKWLLFRNSPLQFFSSSDDDRRAIFTKALHGLSKRRREQTTIPEFVINSEF